MKVSSSLGAAQAAVSGFTELHGDPPGQHVVIDSSNVSGMLDGARVANETLRNVTELISGVKSEAAKVTALAAEIEARDDRDAASWGGM
ncbi:hypothetical protein ACRAWC_02350 [Leifsonia sp. L25]|uniref:hypothetical protein n=1 Tax=Actinomycetes TaxID=1760 RepID=UPI003D69B289